MGKQVRVNLTIDAKIVEKAKEFGLNLSKVSENALKEIIRRIETPDELNGSKKPLLATKKESLERALIPRPAAYKAAALPG